MTKEEWLAEHTKNTEIPVTTIEWVRSLDPSLHFLVKKFPPSCAVKSKNASYECPRDGHYGIVVNYSTAGEIKVIPAPYDDEASYAGMCDPENLEVVGYWGGLTPTKLNEILNG